MAQTSLEEYTRNKKTPFFVLDIDRVSNNYKKFRELFPEFTTFYSVKTNPHKKILTQLNSQKSCFDAATIGEIKLLKSLKIDHSKILFTHPIKLPKTIKAAVDLGVNNFTFDSLDELLLLKKYAPGKRYFLRILPPAEGHFYEYVDKFGASDEDVHSILDYAVENTIDIYGMSFHVGSQTMQIEPWHGTLSFCKEIFKEYYDKLPMFRIMNIGSGFPASYRNLNSPSLETIAEFVHKEIKDFPKGVTFWAEPGRIIVADAVILVCTIIKNVQRIKNRWLFVDMGVYHGLIEVLESRGKLTYPVICFKHGEKITYNISGNTLDPDDTLATAIELPEDLTMGDKLIFKNVGAYTYSLHSNYHALPKPHIYIDKILDS